jgi:hypothetical protein
MRGILGILVVMTLAACWRSAPPDVLLVTFDPTRYDRFGCTGDPEARTPTVDALAARGLVFDRAYASVSLTLPSHTTIMTGLEPFAHGVHDKGASAIASTRASTPTTTRRRPRAVDSISPCRAARPPRSLITRSPGCGRGR